MNLKLTSILSAIALVLAASTATSSAKAYTAKTFKTALAAKVGKKTGASAITAAAGFLKKALTDPKNKGLVTTFTKTTVASLKKPVPAASQVTAATKLVDAVANGYFTKKTYNSKDPAFVKSLTAAGKFVTLKSLKTTASANAISKPLVAFNTKRKGTSDMALFLKKTVFKSLGLTPPVS